VFRRGVACGVAYAYNNTRTDRPFAATTLSFETTAFSAGAISPHRSTNPPGIEFPGTAIEYVRVGRQLNTYDRSLHAFIENLAHAASSSFTSDIRKPSRGGLAERGLMADLIQEWILTRDHFAGETHGDILPVNQVMPYGWRASVLPEYEPK
jgi:hypothetical protein